MTSSRSKRHRILFLALAVIFGVSLGVRAALLVKSAAAVSWSPSLVGAFLLGLLFDAGAAAWILLPLAIALAALPRRFFERRAARLLAYACAAVFIYAQLFGAVAEWLFWDEFSVRFNFVAVDYLVYTTEVLGNIRESYALPEILLGILAGTIALMFLLGRSRLLSRWLDNAAEPARVRWTAAAVWAAIFLTLGLALNERFIPAFANNYNRELAKNGLWSLFAAFRANQLDYDRFYPTIPIDDAFRELNHELDNDRSVLLAATGDRRDTLRWVPPPEPGQPEKRPNVIQITVESLSADYLSSFNRVSRLTPELTAIAGQSLVFDQFYATGTRTDRGMEALTLSIPPTPGRSLIKRPDNGGLFTLGSVFRSRGYDTAFVYGGYGYFDNMNTFFGGNGYRVIDRASVDRTDITFANAWGACDGDLYRWTLREADAAAAAGRPFHFFVMTTSNHRPFTYPEGCIDLPSKISGRAGAVKYTDYAIGQFLHEAKAKRWYRDTVFVIVADHCASVAGKTDLPVQNYHIPLMVFSPGGQIAPGHVTSLMSQIDYAPTLLGLLNWSYASRFYGWDVRHATGDRRALIGNYQRLGLYEPGLLSVLKPVRGADLYNCDPTTFTLSPRDQEETLLRETIAYYQTAAYLWRNGLYRSLTADDQARYARQVALSQGTRTAMDELREGAR